MDSDFHYYGTGSAAIEAGFADADSTLIANVAQYVDWFGSDYWSNWRIVKGDGSPIIGPGRQAFRYKYPQLSVQKIDWKMAVDYDPNIWNTFHFPPGNVTYDVAQNGWQKTFRDRHEVRTTRLGPADVNKLCRPYSKFALDMILDTLHNFEQLSNRGGSDLSSLIEHLVAPRVRCPATDGRTLALYLLGLRIHVLSDTWAHQDFTGEPKYAINGAGQLNDVYAQDANGTYQKSTWTGTVWALRDDTDCAAAPFPGTDRTAAGHGQLGHYPDYSWLKFRYPAPWLPTGSTTHERDNPKEYDEAWSWISFVMGLCNGTKREADKPSEVPGDIRQVMRVWHPLSTGALTAVPASEACWRTTVHGSRIPTRWVPEHREELGLRGGLAATRFGQIDVVQDSPLHYMELAAAIHYQFCVDWLARNREHTWRPWAPRT